MEARAEISMEIIGASSGSGADSDQQHMMDPEVFLAAAEGIVQKLVRCDSDQIATTFLTPAKNTILHVFISSQTKPSPTTVSILLDKCPSLGSLANAKGETPLHIAASHGHADIARVLIKRAAGTIGPVKGGDIESAVSEGGEMRKRMMMRKTNGEGETALHVAVRYGQLSVVRLLVEEEDAEYVYGENRGGESVLYIAVERGDAEVASGILGAFRSPAYGGPNGRTAAHAAVIHGMNDITKDMLTKEGMEHLTKEVDNQGWTLLHHAAHTQSSNLLQWLLWYDRSAAYISDKDGKTALHIAAARNLSLDPFAKYCPDCFELVDQRGRNALHFAAESGSNDAVLSLILGKKFLGYLVNMKDADGNTPLHLLVASGNNIPELIRDPRVDKMAFNNDNLNPLDLFISTKNHDNSTKEIEDLEACLIGANMSAGLRVLQPPENHQKKREKNNTNQQKDNEVLIKIQKELENLNSSGTTRPKEDGDMKEAKEAHLVVAALIATVTFAAGFTMPGGYIQEKGSELGLAVLTRSSAFKAFVITDTIALVFSSAAVFIHLLIAMNASMKGAESLFNKALPLTLYALLAMAIAFITGTYAVLAHSMSLAIAACVVGCLFFVLYGYILSTVVQISLKIGQGFLACYSDFIEFITCQGLCAGARPRNNRHK